MINMSCISKHTKTGKYRIRFRINGKEQCILLPTKDKTKATHIATMVDRLLECQNTGEPDCISKKRSSTIPTTLYNKLVKIGLLKEVKDWTLVGLYDSLMLEKQHLSKSYLQNWSLAFGNLIEFLGNKDIRKVTREDASNFKLWLESHPKKRRNGITPSIVKTSFIQEKQKLGRYPIDAKLAKATINDRLKKIKNLFQFAVKEGLIEYSPFEFIKSPKVTNPKRQRFISTEDSKKILDSCPKQFYRAVFSIARFVGVRVPSELWTLKWEDITWSSEKEKCKVGTIVVHDRKRSSYEGKDTRVSSLWKEVEIELLKWKEESSDSEYIFPEQINGSTLRSRMEKIVFKSGVELYPKIFHNLRSSLETEYHRKGIDPLVYTKWLGNSPEVAIRHYIQYNEYDFNHGIELFTVSTEVSTHKEE